MQLSPDPSLTFKGKVLLVEDDPDQRFLLSMMLEHERYSVQSAANGCEGIEELKRKQFDIIITDICMPKMDGLEFTHEARQIPGNENIPIVLLTAGTVPLSVGSQPYRADAFCLKRDLTGVLLPTIERLVNQ